MHSNSSAVPSTRNILLLLAPPMMISIRISVTPAISNSHFGKKDPLSWDAAGQSNGFESDNDATPTTQSPITAPVFSNVTLVGPQSDTTVALAVGNKFEYGAVIRRNTRLSVHNSVIMGFPFGLSHQK
jgi:hypothetical protein